MVRYGHGLWFALAFVVGCGGTGRGGPTIVANCASGQMSCGGECSNINSDTHNCGGCGISCNNGQSCVQGNCQSGGGNGGGGNGGSTGGGGNGGSTGGGGNGGSTGGGGNGGSTGGGGTGGSSGGATGTCADLINCLNTNMCSDATCFNMCTSMASSQAQQEFSALDTCISTACPTTTGGACATATSTTCTNCVMAAQNSGGQCVSQLSACEPGAGSGGSGGGGTGGSGGSGSVSCQNTITCINNCSATDQTCFTNCLNMASTAAQQQINNIETCINNNCSSSTGGPCATSTSTACTNCLNMVQGTGGACASTLAACM